MNTGRVAQSVLRLATGWTVRGWNPSAGEIFCTCPDLPWGPRSLLYNGYRLFPGGKERPGRDADPPPPSSAVGHERVELYLYSPYEPYSLYRASVPVQGCTLPLPVQIMNLCTVQFPAVLPVTSSLLCTRYHPQHPTLKHPLHIFFPLCERPGFTPIL